MRKHTLAGMMAGAVSALPFSIYFIASILPRVWKDFSSALVKFPILIQHANIILAATSLALILTYIALGLFFGAIAGLVFVVLVNKLPVRSTYAKAVIPSVIIWILPSLFLKPSPRSIVDYLRASLPVLGLFVFDALVFSYLFDRWKDRTKVGNDV